MMSAEYERRLLARARELADLDEIRDDTLSCLGAARHAGLDPTALAGLVGCAAALGASATATYTAGTGWSGTHADERAFLGHIASTDADIDERLSALGRLRNQATAALATAHSDLDDARDQLAGARRQLAAAQAMTTRHPCDGCHPGKAAAISAAQAAIGAAQQLIRDCQIRIGVCEQTIQAIDAAGRRLWHAQARLNAVPHDLGETYESVYNLIRRGGAMPHHGRWLTGTGTSP
jgi:hypothetical protein